MKKYLLNPLRGICTLTLLVLASLITACVVFVTAPPLYLIPVKRWRDKATHAVQHITVYWIDVIKLVLDVMLPGKILVQGSGPLSTKRPYLLVCNHRSWIDILVLSYAFHRKTPSIRFFMKKELLWSLPVAGVAAWLLGYPFMGRHTAAQIRKNPALRHKDMDTTRRACRQFSLYPATIMNYLEGTRFTPEKRLRKNSPYQHLLPPKAGGAAIVLKEMGSSLAGILNATIAYAPPQVSFWQFCCGDFDRVTCEYSLLPITADLVGDYADNREFRVSFQTWLNALWAEKDRELDRLMSSHD